MTEFRLSAEEQERYEAIQRAARALSREIDPPPAVWEGIRTSVASRGRTVRGPRVALTAWRRLGRAERSWLLAAALLVAVLSGGATAIVVRQVSPGDAVASREPGARQEGLAIPVAVQRVEADLARSVGQLERLLAERRADMRPSTVATLEHSLALIDQAIRDARLACLTDPSNPMLLEALSRRYEQKIDLLKRAAELEPRT